MNDILPIPPPDTASVDDVLDAIVAAGRTATERACRSRHHLLDWEEYREVKL